MKASAYIAALAGTFAFGAAFVQSSTASAQTNHAVVVGVTEYPELSKDNWLVGPRNDALLVHTYLTKQSPVHFEPRHVTILADDLEGGKEPTLASILSTLDDLGARVQDGDFVYLQFSGHGFQQVAEDPATETDGLDEIFLPKDTGRWTDRSKGLPNALIDDKIGQALDKIRAKGAFVWIVFDACHSGTATRAAPADKVIERKIDAGAVGMPPDILRGASGQAARALLTRETPDEIGSTAPTRKGGIVAFFAAQTNETTPEMPLPKGGSGAEIYGLFTYTLFSKLAENPHVTYRQLAESILQQYVSINRTSTTPSFEGDLDAPVFGTTIDRFIPQWPIDTSKHGAAIQAGLLHGLIPGTRLAIIRKPGAKLEEAIGFLEVKSADNFFSRLTLVPSPRRESPASPAAKEQTAVGRSVRFLHEIPPGSYARFTESAFNFRLKVARPATFNEFADQVAVVNETLDTIAADEEIPLHIEIVEPGKDADLRLAVFAEKSVVGASPSARADPALWFLGESGELSLDEGRRSPSITMQTDHNAAFRDAFTQYLTHVYRATNLARISQTSDYDTGEVEAAFTLRRKASGQELDVTTTNTPAGVPGDHVHVRARNNTSTAVDINILYIGSDYSITHIRAERLQPSAVLEEDLLEFTDTSYGREIMMAVFTEARPLTPTLDLRYLAQQGLNRAVIRGGTDSIEDLIRGMGFAAISRGVKATANAADGRPRGSVLLFPVRTVPKP